MSAQTLTRQRALSILAVADLVAWQKGLGHDTAALLAGTGITQANLDDPEALITPLQEQAFFQNWLTRDGRPDLGLEVGARYRLMHFGHLGLIVPHAATRLDAIQLFLRFINLSYTHFTPHVDAQAGVLTLQGGEHLGALRRFYLDRDVAFSVGLVREFFKDGTLPLLGVSLDYALPPSAAARYEQALGVPVQFGAPLTQVHVNPARLSEAMPEANALLVRMLQPQCEAREAQVMGSEPVSWTQRVQAALHQHDQRGPWPEAADVARKLRCSERTLRRHLALEGGHFQTLSDAARSQRATQWLQRREASLDDIAAALGYSEAAAFIRAYKRWFGRPPGQDRR
ncbi:MAG: AraC family transcriptional regulator [Acidobacteriota bacterium]